MTTQAIETAKLNCRFFMELYCLCCHHYGL